MRKVIVMDGKALAEKCLGETKAEIAALKAKPTLAIVLVGDDPASLIYVRNKDKKAKLVGIATKLYHLPEDTSEKHLLKLVTKLSKSRRINGVLVQLPLPDHIDAAKIIAAIDPLKDVDGFTTENIGKLAMKKDCLTPCTPLGCIKLLKTVEPNLAGLKAVVIGRSQIVGRPLAQMLLNEDCTVTIAHRKTQDLPELCLTADILAVACGCPQMVRGSWIKEGAIVLDIGISYDKNRKISGDVVFDEALEKARAITPVPGGVGPMTIAMLMANTLKAYKLQKGIKVGL